MYRKVVIQLFIFVYDDIVSTIIKPLVIMKRLPESFFIEDSRVNAFY